MPDSIGRPDAFIAAPAVTSTGAPLGSARRRRFALGAVGSALALAFGALPAWGPWFGVNNARAADSEADTFLLLSERLTGRVALDAQLGQRMHDALIQADQHFPQNAAALLAWLQSHPQTPLETLGATLQAEQPALAKTSVAILDAWYLGVVGESPHAKVIAYERALMFDPVKDVLTIPSYCRDVPGYWAAPPAHA
jgi:hypothetical protein